MSERPPAPDYRTETANWWATAVSRIAPGVVELRGRPVQELIGTTGFVSTIWLMLRGELPGPAQAALLEAALVASVDHGPQAPSIATARMAATCGIGLNSAVATGVNVLGDVHGGAGQQCVELLNEIVESAGDTSATDAAADGPATTDWATIGPAAADTAAIDGAAERIVAQWRARSPYLPGYGHRFHPLDPRRAPLLGLLDDAVADGIVGGRHLAAARAVETVLNRGRTRPVPMNIDGATAAIYAELGFPPPLARGLFVLSRSVGILAHAFEETQQGRRIKGPIPPSILPTYLGQDSPAQP